MTKPINMRNESDLRSIMLKRKKLFRIEAQVGGTVGLPDTFWSYQRCAVFCEIKMGTISSSQTLSYSVRPDQRRTLTEMQQQMLPVSILVGVKNTRSAWCMHINNETIIGTIMIERLKQVGWARLIDVDDDWMMDDIAEHSLASRKE